MRRMENIKGEVWGIQWNRNDTMLLSKSTRFIYEIYGGVKDGFIVVVA